MCEPPIKLDESGTLSETPLGLATSIGSNVWVAKDVPILFHTFEYIGRNAILNWWQSMVSDGQVT
jgi:hypothetical protein